MLAECLPVIRAAFATVLEDMGLGQDDVPTNAAFLTMDRLRRWFTTGTRVFALVSDGLVAGCCTLRRGAHDGVVELERLAVLPSQRHRGYGSRLVEHAVAEARAAGAQAVGIGIIESNDVLRRWYVANGFVPLGSASYEHLPFTVLTMRRPC